MKQVTENREKLRETITIAPILRQQYLQEIAIALELDEKYPTGKIIRELMVIE